MSTYQSRWFNIGVLAPGLYPLNPYSSSTWGAYFADPHCLDALLPHFDVFQIPWDWTDHPNWANDPNHMWSNLFRILAVNKKQVAFSGGYISGTAPPVNGVSIAGDDLTAIAQMTALGSPIPTIVMDGFPILFLGQTNMALTVPTWTPAQAYTELVNYATTIYATYPNAKIGHDVNLPLWPLYSQTMYYGPEPAGTVANIKQTGFVINGITVNINYWKLPSYDTVFIGMGTALGGAGFPNFAFEQVDFPYDYLMNFRPLLPGTVGYAAPPDWIGPIITFQEFCQSRPIPFGLQLNAEYSAQTSTPTGGPERYYYEVQDMLGQYLGRGGKTDQLVWIVFFQPPNPTPFQLLPVLSFIPQVKDAPFSYGSVMKALDTGNPLNVPCFQLYALNFDPEYLEQDNMTNRAFFLRGGYQQQRTSFYEPGGLIQWQSTPGLQNLFRATKGIDVVIDKDQAYIQNLAAAGWSITPCSAWGSISPFPPGE